METHRFSFVEFLEFIYIFWIIMFVCIYVLKLSSTLRFWILFCSTPGVKPSIWLLIWRPWVLEGNLAYSRSALYIWFIDYNFFYCSYKLFMWLLIWEVVGIKGAYGIWQVVDLFLSNLHLDGYLMIVVLYKSFSHEVEWAVSDWECCKKTEILEYCSA